VSSLARRLGTRDAVVIGLGSMIGAGVFAAFAPAAQAAGSALLLGLALAAGVAFCNATASAQLAAQYPTSGGTYIYGRERLGEWWGFVAGWGFVIGKTGSCAAMALTFASYAVHGSLHLQRVVALVAVLALTAVNLRGITRTAALARVLVVLSIASLLVVVLAIATSGSTESAHLDDLPFGTGGAHGIFQAAALLFFAFAGYARIATLGEEVRDPERTIPRAIPIALGITLVIYAAVIASALTAVGADVLGSSSAPLADAVQVGRFASLAPVVRIGAAVASLGVLLSLIVGVSRTTFAMAAARDLPAWLDAVHPQHRVPHRAELAIGAAVIALVAAFDIGGAIGFSSFTVLLYYAVTNASALTLPRDGHRRSRAIAVLGLAGCVLVAVSLPRASVVSGAIVLAAGGALFGLRRLTRGA
jgi:APA family basic amino acid/polyamine antiporter